MIAARHFHIWQTDTTLSPNPPAPILRRSIRQIQADALLAFIPGRLHVGILHAARTPAEATRFLVIGVQHQHIIRRVRHGDAQVGVRLVRMEVEDEHQRPAAIDQLLVVFVDAKLFDERIVQQVEALVERSIAWSKSFKPA